MISVQSARRTSARQIILVDINPAIYESTERYHCPKCGNIYPSDLAKCPLCRCQTAPQRPTTVWTRTFYIAESLDELHGRELIEIHEQSEKNEDEELLNDVDQNEA